MRVVAGKLRHRYIEMTNLETTRETQDKVRGAIFNMIGPYFDGGIALDLFAGSGAMGIEACSRGVDKIYLNDIEPKALAICKKNCQNLGIDNVIYSNKDYLDFLKSIKIKFDYIFLDPPYKMDNIDFILNSVLTHLNKKGFVIFELGESSNYPNTLGNIKLIKEKKYGIKKVIIYQNMEV